MESESIVDIQLRIKAVVIYNFLVLYSELENSVRDIFVKIVPRLDEAKKNVLYFYYGGRIGTTYDYPNEAIKLRDLNFKENERFKDFTINEIIKIDRKRTMITVFPETLPSLQRRVTFVFKDCIIKLIQMRNKLAHEMCDCKFDDAQIIEILSDNHLKNANYQFLEGFDLTLADDMTKAILSNYVYMENIMKELCSVKDKLQQPS